MYGEAESAAMVIYRHCMQPDIYTECRVCRHGIYLVWTWTNHSTPPYIWVSAFGFWCRANAKCKKLCTHIRCIQWPLANDANWRMQTHKCRICLHTHSLAYSFTRSLHLFISTHRTQIFIDLSMNSQVVFDRNALITNILSATRAANAVLVFKLILRERQTHELQMFDRIVSNLFRINFQCRDFSVSFFLLSSSLGWCGGRLSSPLILLLPLLPLQPNT